MRNFIRQYAIISHNIDTDRLCILVFISCPFKRNTSTLHTSPVADDRSFLLIVCEQKKSDRLDSRANRHVRIQRLQSRVGAGRVYHIVYSVFVSTEARGMPKSFVTYTVRNQIVLERNTIFVDFEHYAP